MRNAKSVNVVSILVTCLFVSVSLIRIGSCYKSFNQTMDEPATIATGMEMLTKGTYKFEHDHPPLARMAAAFLPYLHGASLCEKYLPKKTESGNLKMTSAGNAILLSGGNYFHVLSLARAGILPFFVISVLFVYLWGYITFGATPACIGASIYTMVPVIIGHSSVATNDMAVTAMMLGSLMCYVLWLNKPSVVKAMLFGLFVGLSVSSKFSSIPFLLFCCLALAVAKKVTEMKGGSFKNGVGGRQITLVLRDLTVSGFVAFMVIWGCYGFSVGPILDPLLRADIENALAGAPSLKSIILTLGSVPVPFPELFSGIIRVLQHNMLGHPSFFLGELRQYGVWYYFPLMLLFKTPLAFLLMSLLGLIVLYFKVNRVNFWRIYAPSICAFIIMLFSMGSNINIGVRYILIVLPLLSMNAGYFIYYLWRSKRNQLVVKSIAVVLCAWLIIVSYRGSSDYLGFTSVLAGEHPELLFSDSDLDWGQHLLALKREIETLKIDKFWLAYFGSATPEMVGIKNATILKPCSPVQGWVAISVWCLHQDLPHQEGFGWLRNYKPVKVINGAIRLYHIESSECDEKVEKGYGSN